MKIKKIWIGEMENAGCNNGNYPSVSITLDNGEVLKGHTCGCTRGCSGTWYLPEVGSEFKNVAELYSYMMEE